MFYTIIISKTDPAGMNIALSLIEKFGFEETSRTFDNNPIYKNNPKNMQLAFINSRQIFADNVNSLDGDAYIFASLHRGNKPCLTVHPIGNFGKAEFGGKDKALVPSLPKIMKSYLIELNRQKEERKLEYDVCYEATHHGPALTKPTLFIEIGNDEAHWADKSAAEVIAETIMNSTKPSGKRIALNIGGQHYPHYTTKLALATDIAFSHMCPEWALKDFTGQSLNEMIAKTPEKIDLIAVEWKGLGKEKERIMKILESQSLPFEKADKIK